MKKKYLQQITCLVLLLGVKISFAQCSWQNTLTDGFEYQTICPDIVPGTTVHNTPQAFAVHSGSYSLYLNFINCTAGSGTCAGDTVYKRHFSVCRNMTVRFSAWLTTSFNGLQCDMRIVIVDGNGIVLNLQPNVVAPYSPAWIQYSSGSITPSTDDVYFIMITNVGGGNGNDLSMDDFLFETCYPTVLGSSYAGNICSSVLQQNLFQYLPANSDTTGTWSGTGTLGGGFLGIFTNGTSPWGQYVYTSHYYGMGAGCPATTDTIVTASIPGPMPLLGNDTTICSNQSLYLNPGSFPGSTLLWNNGITAPIIVASTTIITGDTNTYWVQVTAQNGCVGTDTVTIIFTNCTGTNELNDEMYCNIVVDKQQNIIQIKTNNKNINAVEIIDATGRLYKNIKMNNTQAIEASSFSSGVYFIKLSTSQKNIIRKFVW